MRAPLTPREYVVACLVAEGQRNREIAAQLGVSVWTVKTHVKAILVKSGARNRVQVAVAVARTRT